MRKYLGRKAIILRRVPFINFPTVIRVIISQWRSAQMTFGQTESQHRFPEYSVWYHQSLSLHKASVVVFNPNNFAKKMSKLVDPKTAFSTTEIFQASIEIIIFIVPSPLCTYPLECSGTLLVINHNEQYFNFSSIDFHASCFVLFIS